jgi:hypothetical protein
MRRHLTYANITATVALFIALGGSAYAISQIGSKDIRNGAIKSADLRDHQAVANKDVRRNGLRGNAIQESSLNASRFSSLTGNDVLSCDPNSPSVYVSCVSTTLHLAKAARVLAMTTGDEESVGGPASATCQLRIDDEPAPIPTAPGESSVDNSSALATNGFARTLVSRDPLTPGKHKVSLACAELSGNVKIDVPTIAAIAINEP